MAACRDAQFRDSDSVPRVPIGSAGPGRGRLRRLGLAPRHARASRCHDRHHDGRLDRRPEPAFDAGDGRRHDPARGRAGTPLAATTAPDWPVYHRNRTRSGYDPGFPAPGTLTQAWSASLDGAVYGQPIVVGGRIIAATENDTVYALDPASGAVLWKHHLGTPVPLSTLPCGNIDPLGITSTMAYDAATGSIFASAELAGPKHPCSP